MPLDREILERTEQTSLVICVTYSGADAGHTEQKERSRPYSLPQIDYLSHCIFLIGWVIVTAKHGFILFLPLSVYPPNVESYSVLYFHCTLLL